VTVLIVAIGISNEQRSVKSIQNNMLIAAKTLIDDLGSRSPSDRVTFDRQQKAAGELQSFSRKLADPLGSTQLLDALSDHYSSLSRIYDQAIHVSDDPEVKKYADLLGGSRGVLRDQRYSLLSGRWIGIILLTAASIALLLLYLRSAASLQSSDRWALVFDLMWIDLVDLLTLAVPLAAISLGSLIDWQWIPIAQITVTVISLTRFVIAARFKATPGMLLMHKRIAPIRPRNAGAASVQREMLFTVWTALNVVTLGVLWLTVLPACAAYRERTLVDLLAGTRLEESNTQPAPGASRTAQQATAVA